MTFREKISSALSGTSMEETLLTLDDVYRDADTATSGWERESGLACARGCGECCKRFMPDILPPEALYLAVWIALEAPDLMETLETFNGKHCPLYSENTPFHCAVYPARPLVCRMFGMSGITGKTGEREFRLCFAMRPDSEKRVFSGAEIEREFDAIPPSIADHGFRVASILPDRAHERRPLPEAVKDASAKIMTTLSIRNS